MPVKRLIWEQDHTLFVDELSQILEQILQKRMQSQSQLADPSNPSNPVNPVSPSAQAQTQSDPLTQPVRERRLCLQTRELAEMCASAPLVALFLQYMRTLFVSTSNLHYPVLRSDVLLALQERGLLTATTAIGATASSSAIRSSSSMAISAMDVSSAVGGVGAYGTGPAHKFLSSLHSALHEIELQLAASTNIAQSASSTGPSHSSQTLSAFTTPHSTRTDSSK